MHFHDIFRGVMKECRKQKVYLLSLSLLTHCQLCVYVCVCVCVCVCVLLHEGVWASCTARTPVCYHTRFPQVSAARGAHKHTNEQINSHIQLYTRTLLSVYACVSVHQCVGGRWYPWLTWRSYKPHCFWIPGSTSYSYKLWFYLPGSVCVCVCVCVCVWERERERESVCVF